MGLVAPNMALLVWGVGLVEEQLLHMAGESWDESSLCTGLVCNLNWWDGLVGWMRCGPGTSQQLWWTL